MTHPLVCNVELQLSDGFVPGDPGSFRALDDEEFFVTEGSLGVALTPGVLLPGGVRPPVEALISG